MQNSSSWGVMRHIVGAYAKPSLVSFPLQLLLSEHTARRGFCNLSTFAILGGLCSRTVPLYPSFAMFALFGEKSRVYRVTSLCCTVLAVLYSTKSRQSGTFLGAFSSQSSSTAFHCQLFPSPSLLYSRLLNDQIPHGFGTTNCLASIYSDNVNIARNKNNAQCRFVLTCG